MVILAFLYKWSMVKCPFCSPQYGLDVTTMFGAFISISKNLKKINHVYTCYFNLLGRFYFNRNRSKQAGHYKKGKVLPI